MHGNLQGWAIVYRNKTSCKIKTESSTFQTTSTYVRNSYAIRMNKTK